jgi:hypothetical protein
MPIDPRRRDDIAAAVAAHDSANPSMPLPRNAARLLAAMFASDDVCQRSLEDIAAEGFARNRLSALLRRRPTNYCGTRGTPRSQIATDPQSAGHRPS